MYKPSDWYWFIGADTENVWSSARAMSVPISDPDYVLWSEVNPISPTLATMAELEDTLRVSYPRGTLPTYTAHVRQQTGGGGIVVNGLPFATDALTLGSLNSAYIYTQAKTASTFSWKLPDGSFITLDMADIAALQNAANEFWQNCFTCEDTTLTGIEGGTITTHAQIDAAFAAISNTFTGLTADLEVRHRRK